MTAVQQLASTGAPAGPRSVNGTGHDVDVDMDRDSRIPPLALGSKFGSGPQKGDTRILVIMYGHGQEDIVSVFAEVLGKPFCARPGFQDITQKERGLVVGILADSAKADITARNQELVVAINAHCVNQGMPPDLYLSTQCDYEFLYTSNPLSRRDLCRFISFTLGQINHHETLMAKSRTYFISTTFPDVRAALPNLDILTVGADAVEIRVDLLKEPLEDGTFSPIPSLSYVGEQVMLLRQKTELPIIFTTRCTRENGRFPMTNPDLYYEYLHRAIKWGVEYIDVELWLPEAIRKRLFDERGNSRIMSAFHDFSGTFKWTSTHAQSVFLASRRYADIIKMIAIINERNENFELEYFRSKMKADYPDSPPFSAVNMEEAGQFSRTLNRVFTPITHPLLPIPGAPGQMSAAQINAALSLLGQLPKKSIYGISSPATRSATPQAPFYEKCFNELGLPHRFAVVERQLKGSGGLEVWCDQKDFGGAYLNPPVSFSSLVANSSFFSTLNSDTGPILTEAARVIGVVDSIIVQSGPSSPASTFASASVPSSPPQPTATATAGLPPNTRLVFDNASWRGILATLTRDFSPAAYRGRAAVVLGSTADEAASAVFALRALRVNKIYTVGFKTPPALAALVEPFNSLESLQRARAVDGDDAASPFAIVSALAPEKGNLVAMLLRMFGSPQQQQQQQQHEKNGVSSGGGGREARKVFLDLAALQDQRRPGVPDPGAVAAQSGFAAYGVADATAFTTVETLRSLVGQNVPYSFVRLASGRSWY